jgi:hypothetical protein
MVDYIRSCTLRRNVLSKDLFFMIDLFSSTEAKARQTYRIDQFFAPKQTGTFILGE